MTARKTTRSGAGSDLPETLDAYVRKLRAKLTQLERQIATKRAEASRRGTKLLREASEYLGRIEERGERAWWKGRKEAARLLDRLEKKIEPKPTRRPRKKAAAGTRTQRTSARKRNSASTRTAAPRSSSS